MISQRNYLLEIANDQPKQKGVSVIVCCYNSSLRLGPTLTALSKQHVRSGIDWEIIIVDNASEDNTSTLSAEIWQAIKEKNAVPFIVAKEAKPGLGYARKKGISIASYNFILFCDDDNWLAKDYVQGIYDILNSNHLIAACGGKGIPVFQSKKPIWFDEYAEAYAVGPQTVAVGESKILNLYGAGMAVNYSAIEKLEMSGFQPQMTGRTGKKLSSSEDTELTYALVLMGYQLHYEESLHFFHYLPKERLQFEYLKKLFVAFGTDGPVRNIYYSHVSKRIFHQLIRYWYFHVSLSLFRLVKYLIIPPKKYGRFIYFKWNIAYLRQLFLIKKTYPSIVQNIQLVHNHLPLQAIAAIQQHDLYTL